MCGIFGYWDRQQQPLGDEALRGMAKALFHRGPDDEGIHHRPQRGVAIGNRRLSIIDLGGGHQPFVSDDGQIAVVQNGEIFNFVELAAELRASRASSSRRHSDTEVILRLYEREGIGCLCASSTACSRLRSTTRVKTRCTLCATASASSLSMWPTTAKRVVFGSEIKAIVACSGPSMGRQFAIDSESIHHYLTFNYIPGAVDGVPRA